MTNKVGIVVFTLCFSSGRLCNEDCVVGNLLVKKGVQVLAQVYTMHHNAELWSNPEKFDPERYTNKRMRTDVRTYMFSMLHVPILGTDAMQYYVNTFQYQNTKSYNYSRIQHANNCSTSLRWDC